MKRHLKPYLKPVLVGVGVRLLLISAQAPTTGLCRIHHEIAGQGIEATDDEVAVVIEQLPHHLIWHLKLPSATVLKTISPNALSQSLINVLEVIDEAPIHLHLHHQCPRLMENDQVERRILLGTLSNDKNNEIIHKIKQIYLFMY